MDTILSVTTYFLLCLALGLSLSLALIPVAHTGQGLVKVLAGILGISFIIGEAIIIRKLGGIVWNWVALGLFALGMFGALWEKGVPWPKRMPFVTGGLTLACLLGSYPLVGKQWIPISMFLSTALFLGSIHYCMILGHWYLVTPKLSEEFLLKGMRFFWASLIPKLLLGVWGTVLLYRQLTPDNPAFSWFDFDQMCLWLRFLWGHLMIIVLGVFAWKLVKMRSIQSATGVLYVMVFFALIGELLALYLFIHRGIPL